MHRHLSGPRLAALLLVAVLAVACSEHPAVTGIDPQFNNGKGGGTKQETVAVENVDPSHGNRGQTLIGIRITGSGFDATAQASWERNSIPAPGITVLATRFISSTTIEADIEIADDADLDLYDVAVSMSIGGGKRGVGIEMFEVTQAHVIGTLCTGGNAFARGVNDIGHVVGNSCTSAFYWHGGAMVPLSTGVATDIDEAGNIIIGASWSSMTRSQDGPALIWQRSGTGWTRVELPSLGYTARANAVASDGDGAAFLIGGAYKLPLKAKKFATRPMLWRRQGSRWEPVVLPLPPGHPEDGNARVLTVTATGLAAGGADQTPVLWEPNGNGGYTVTVLTGPGAIHGISADLQLAAGAAGNTAVYSSSTGSWANDVSPDGLVVGKDCDRAGAWLIDGGFIPYKLGGLGNRDDSQEVWAASRTRLVGNAKGLAVYWDRLF
jgi:hypothetical protein